MKDRIVANTDDIQNLRILYIDHSPGGHYTADKAASAGKKP